MTDDTTTIDSLLAPLLSPTGGFTMLALDQRESLRRMFPLSGGQEVDDQTLRAFKAAAIRELTPLASAVLLDRPLAVTTDRPAGIDEASGLILAADVLDQPAGQPVLTTSLDPLVTPEFIHHVGAVAIKLLVIWRADGSEDARERLVREFVAVAEEAGVASLVEGIVRPASGDEWTSPEERHLAILEAARELSSYGGTIYKAEVPGYLPGDVSGVREQARRMSDLVDGPWVVLSNGVALADFADAVREACAGGASGFLAGRAIWSDVVAVPDPVVALTGRPRERLQVLTRIVAESCGS
jgi:sulfofructosephosphate aldolase